MAIDNGFDHVKASGWVLMTVWIMLKLLGGYCRRFGSCLSFWVGIDDGFDHVKASGWELMTVLIIIKLLGGY